MTVWILYRYEMCQHLTSLTFAYIKNYQIVFGWGRFNRIHNVTNKSYPMIFQRGTVETTPSKDVIANHPLLFYKNQ